jgi:Anti-sigma-K factor rskA
MAEQGPQNQPDEAMLDLLIKQVTEGLSPEEQRELDVMDNASVSAHERALERTTAAVTLAGVPRPEPLPAALAARLEAAGRSALGGVVAPRVAPPVAARTRASYGHVLGWWAAAACLLLALFGWLRSPPAPPGPETASLPPSAVVVAPPEPPAPPPTPAQAREAMLAAPGAVKIELGATKDPAAAGMSGDVVWDPAAQRGYVRLVGLKPNDPRQHQYQLWIFDGERDQRYPVDGGVFDIPEGSSEVVLPLRAEVVVRAAKAFALTLEKPGGVVVSARDHVIALGKVG